MERAAKLGAALALTAAFWGGGAAGAPLPVTGPGLPAGFRDVSLEHRCDALAAFVRAFAAAHLPGLAYKEAGCGEGNGLGGARYTFEFRLGPADGRAPLGLRLDVAYAGDFAAAGDVRLCATDARPTVCSKTGVAALDALHANAARLLPTVAAWVAAAPTQHLIYGLTYDAFLARMLAYRDGLPVAKADGTGRLHVRLVPAPAGPARGTVQVVAPVDPDVLRCFRCADVACMSDGVEYRFDDRYFTLTRRVPGEGDVGASWIVTGPRPLGEGEATWKYACGVSRYSLQSVNL